VTYDDGPGRTPQSTFAFGLRMGYPVCCILDYICDLQHDRMPAALRGRVVNSEHVYVPCRRCH